MAKGTYSYIKWFEELKRRHPIRRGKGANLGEMTNHGIPVPPGFCVLAKAYKDFVTQSNINKVIEDLVSKINFEDANDLEEKRLKYATSLWRQICLFKSKETFCKLTLSWQNLLI